MSASPTEMRPRIAITRSREDSRSLAAALRARGAEVSIHPAIRRLPPSDPKPLEEALERLRGGRYHGLLFTSPAGVEAVRHLLGDAPFPAALFGAVGPATRAALEAWGKGPIVVAPHHDGASLAQALIEALGGGLPGLCFLQPRAEEGREELRRGLEAAGAEVEVVAAYRTVPEPPARLAALREGLGAGAFDAVIFASPSAVRAVVGEGSPRWGETWAVAIGETTARALRKAGVTRVAAAAEATDEALIEEVARLLDT